MHPKNPLLQKCIKSLELLPHLQASIQGEPYLSSHILADGQLIIKTTHGTVQYICEVKTGLTYAGLEPVIQYIKQLEQRLDDKQRPLLITKDLSNLVVAQLIEQNIEFIDINGNIFLNSPIIYLLVCKQDPQNTNNYSLELTDSALQVIYIILKKPDVLIKSNPFYREIVSQSRLRLPAVKKTIQKLQRLGYLNDKKGQYTISNYLKLCERWELGYFEKLRQKLIIGTFKPIGNKNLSDLETNLKKYADKNYYLIGGELAASLLTQNLRPVSATLHIDQNIDYRQIAVKLKLKPDTDGNIILFKNLFDANYPNVQLEDLQNKIAHPLLIHAELVQSGNSRLQETANLIYEKYIKPIANQND